MFPGLLCCFESLHAPHTVSSLADICSLPRQPNRSSLDMFTGPQETSLIFTQESGCLPKEWSSFRGHLGAILGHLGAILGPLRASSGHSGTILGSECIPTAKQSISSCSTIPSPAECAKRLSMDSRPARGIQRDRAICTVPCACMPIDANS